MTDLSRRSMLPAAAAAAVIALPAVADSVETPDARLFELKQEFDRVAAEREQVETDYADAFAEWDRRMELAQRTRNIKFLRGIPRHNEACDLIHELDLQQDRTVAQMQAHGAKTLAGLAVIATAIKEHDLPSFWNETDEDADWTDLQARRLIDMVIAFAAGGANV